MKKTYFRVEIGRHEVYGFETLDRALCFIQTMEGASKKAHMQTMPEVTINEFPEPEEGDGYA